MSAQLHRSMRFVSRVSPVQRINACRSRDRRHPDQPLVQVQPVMRQPAAPFASATVIFEAVSFVGLPFTLYA